MGSPGAGYTSADLLRQYRNLLHPAYCLKQDICPTKIAVNAVKASCSTKCASISTEEPGTPPGRNHASSLAMSRSFPKSISFHAKLPKFPWCLSSSFLNEASWATAAVFINIFASNIASNAAAATAAAANHTSP